MTILIDSSKRVAVQGMTGREGIARTRLMKGYGTQVIAGVTPGMSVRTATQKPPPRSFPYPFSVCR